LTVEGEVVDSDGELPVNVLLAVDDKDLQSRCDEARKESSVNKDSMYWVMVIGSEMDKSVVELYRSREMVADNERSPPMANYPQRSLPACLMRR
jgi:hypothetical protein